MTKNVLAQRMTKSALQGLIVCLALLCSFNFYGQTKQPFAASVKRILFLGNSITYAGTYITDIETYIVAHYPGTDYEFINVGLPSETVSGLNEPNHAGGKFPRPDLHERLARVLAQTKPDVVLACYGMNDGIYMAYDEQRFSAFRSGILWLHEELVKTGVTRIIHLTPPVHDDQKLGTNGYNLVLDKYSSWLLAQRDSLHWEVADIHFAMTTYLNDERKTNPSFKLAADGVHPGKTGHWLMARAILMYLGQPVDDVPDIQAALAGNKNGMKIFELISKRQAIMKDAWLGATGHQRPEMKKGLPLAEALQQYKQVQVQIRETNR